MSFMNGLRDWSRGDYMSRFWSLFRLRNRCKSKIIRNILTLILNRRAHRHGGYVGNGAVIKGELSLPHGLHGVFISRYAKIDEGCRIYQNVTIGEVKHKAPEIGKNCLIGAGAIIVGDIKIGDNVKIGAGAVIFKDVPEGATVLSPEPRVILREEEDDR